MRSNTTQEEAKTMRENVIFHGKKRAINLAHIKPKKFHQQFSGLVIYEGRIKEAVTLKIYKTPAIFSAVVYVDGGNRTEGSAQNNAYMADAVILSLQAAGIELKDHGRDTRYMVEMICRYFYPDSKEVFIVNAHNGG